MVGQLVEARVAPDGVVEAHEPLFEARLGFEHIRSIGPRLDSALVIGDGRCVVFGHGLHAAQHDGPAVVERRAGDGFAIERQHPRGLVVRHGVGRGFPGERFVLGVTVHHFDVLVHGAGGVLQALQRGDQAAADGGDPFQPLRGRQLGLLQPLDDGELEIAEAAVVLGLEIRVRHGGEVFGAQRLGFEQPRQQSAGAFRLAGRGFDARRFQRELRGQIGAGMFGGFEQNVDGRRGLAVAHVKIDGGAHHPENQRMVAIQSRPRRWPRRRSPSSIRAAARGPA